MRPLAHHNLTFNNVTTQNKSNALCRTLCSVFISMSCICYSHFANAEPTQNLAALWQAQNEAATQTELQSTLPTVEQSHLAEQLKVGDLVFIRVLAKPFLEVAAATHSWTNHVGIVTKADKINPTISESTFPFSRKTTLTKFVARSDNGRVAITGLNTPLTPEQEALIEQAAQQRNGIFYDTGFNLHSKRQFCSRFAHEVLEQATGVQVGKIETFKDMFDQGLANDAQINLGFWKKWYLGNIPWQRETITPASMLNSSATIQVFDGEVVKNKG